MWKVLKKSLVLSGLLLWMAMLFFPFADAADITIVEGTIISIGDGHTLTLAKNMTFPLPITYGNGFTDGRGFSINSSRSFTLDCWFENNWINYTSTGLSTQYVFNGSKPTLVILSGTNKTEGDGWSYSSSTHVIFVSSLSTVEIYFGPLSVPPTPPIGALQVAPLDGQTGRYPLVYATNISMYYPATTSLGVQAQATLNMLVTSGAWDTVQTNITVYTNWGIISFIPTSSVNITVTTEGAVEKVALQVSGEGSSITQISDTEWQVGFTQPYPSSLSWNSPIVSYVDMYTMLAVGCVGIGMMVFVPSWIAWHVKDHGMDEDTWERIFLGMCFFFMGMGLFLTWVWP